MGPVREYLLCATSFQGNGLIIRSACSPTLLQEHQERLTDVPYALAEGVKQGMDRRAMAERHVRRTAQRPGLGEMADGLQRRWCGPGCSGANKSRKLEANRISCSENPQGVAAPESVEMFEDSERFGRLGRCARCTSSVLGLERSSNRYSSGKRVMPTPSPMRLATFTSLTQSLVARPFLSAVIEAQTSDALACWIRQLRSGWVSTSENASAKPPTAT